MKKFLLPTLLFFILCLAACSKDDATHLDDNPDVELNYGLGLTSDQNFSKIPLNVSFGFGSGNLPSAYDLTDKLPPVGDQGQYGTCVAWALGYNLKTILSAVDRGLSTADLQNPQNHFSPKYLFANIPDVEKGPNCEGTGFESAFTVMQDKGIATEKAVPYTNLGNCNQSTADLSWDAEAGNYKIKYFRRVEPTIEEMKKNISSNIPVAIGIDVTDNFLTWNSDDVMSTKSTSNIPTIHGKHAVLVVGYDDNKGPNGAMRVVNSWSADWGDVGFVWVDYNFLINELIMQGADGSKAIFVAENQDGDTVVPNEDDSPSKQGVDLASWVYYDYSLYEQGGEYNERLITYDVFNIGTQRLNSSSSVGFHYYIVNPYDLNDYLLIFKDELTNSLASGTYNCPSANECYLNVNIEPGASVAGGMGWNGIERTYYMPQVTGEFYVVLVADAEGLVKEGDEQNNLFFSAPYPVYIDGGWVKTRKEEKGAIADHAVSGKGVPTPQLNKPSKPQQRNAYTSEEITAFIKSEIESQNHLSHVYQVNKSVQLNDISR